MQEQLVIKANLPFHIAVAATVFIFLLCVIFFVFYLALKGDGKSGKGAISARTLRETQNFAYMSLFFFIYTLAEPLVLILVNQKLVIYITRIELSFSMIAMYFLLRLVHVYNHIEETVKAKRMEYIFLAICIAAGIVFIVTQGLVTNNIGSMGEYGWAVEMGPLFYFVYAPILLFIITYSIVRIVGSRKHFSGDSVDRLRYKLILIGITCMAMAAVTESLRAVNVLVLDKLGDSSVIGIMLMAFMFGLSAVYKFYSIQRENASSEVALQELIRQIDAVLNEASDAIERLGIRSGDFKSESENILSLAKESQVSTEEAVGYANNEKEQIRNFSTMVIGNITTLEMILESMREQTKRVENFFEVIGEISKILNDISDKGTVVSGGVVNLNSVITDAKRKSGKNYQLMVAVRNSIESIVHISQTIEKISEDSNILAMNASIESANSGESGKGFKVVADDLRKLSEMTKFETAKIQIILNKLNQDLKIGENAAKLVENFFIELESAIEEIFRFILNIVNQTKNIIPVLEESTHEVSSLMDIAHNSEGYGTEQQELNNILNDTIIDEKFLLESIRRAMEEERESLIVMLDFAETSFSEASENTQFVQELMVLFDRIKNLFVKKSDSSSDIKLVE